jgi:G:T-mismatch repair DNA endonuclease (very short patch repair protein)
MTARQGIARRLWQQAEYRAKVIAGLERFRNGPWYERSRAEAVVGMLVSRLRSVICKKCGVMFEARDWKAVVCKKCQTTCACGNGKWKGSLRCRQCGQAMSVEGRERQRQAITGCRNPAKRKSVKEKISKALKNGRHAVFTTPGFRAKLREHAHKIGKGQFSKPEMCLGSFFSEWERHGRIGWFQFDLVHRASRTVVEMHGCFYHGCKLCCKDSRAHRIPQYAIKRDKQKAEYLARHGWKLFVVWEHTVMGRIGPLVMFVNRVEKYVQSIENN